MQRGGEKERGAGGGEGRGSARARAYILRGMCEVPPGRDARWTW